MSQNAPDKGMFHFTLVWFGQFISFIGTAMTGFGISIWIYEQSHQATALTWSAFAFIAPSILLSPFAGAIVDRHNRKNIMIFTDLIAGLGTTTLLILFATGNLHLWHIYVVNAFSGAANSFQFPAYSAAVTMMLHKSQYGRASGMMALAEAASGITAPAIAAVMLRVTGLTGIMLVDVVTFVFAVSTLAMIHIPQPPVSGHSPTEKTTLWQEAAYGFTYIFQRPSLLGLQMVFFFVNLLSTLSFAVVVPMILSRTGNNETILASVQSLGAIGGVLGGLLLSVWGGPKRKVHGVLIGMIVTSLFGEALMGVGQGLFIWATASFFTQFAIPTLNGSNQAIWQAKVSPDIQGRVFSVRRLIAQITAPLAVAMAGPLADKVFEPAMREGTALSNTFKWLIPVGPGAGMALMFVITGLAGVLVGLGGYLFPAIRDAETILPDHDAVPVSPEGA